jgi:hypothetical protein
MFPEVFQTLLHPLSPVLHRKSAPILIGCTSTGDFFFKSFSQIQWEFTKDPLVKGIDNFQIHEPSLYSGVT